MKRVRSFLFDRKWSTVDIMVVTLVAIILADFMLEVACQ